MRNWLQRMSFKFGRYAIENLMMYIVMGMGLVFALDTFMGMNLYGLLMFHWGAILNGQIWRLVTFIFLPPSSSLIFILISLYFYYMLGSTLEYEWGASKFNIYYFTGMIGSIIAGVITGYATNQFLNMSLFFAFAILYPNYTILLFFILPIKMKYLAMFNAVMYVISFIQGGISTKVSIVFSLLNVILFFGGQLKTSAIQAYKRYKWRQNFK